MYVLINIAISVEKNDFTNSVPGITGRKQPMFSVTRICTCALVHIRLNKNTPNHQSLKGLIVAVVLPRANLNV